MFAECIDDADWIRRCITMEIDGTRQRIWPRKTWWDAGKEDVKVLACPDSDSKNPDSNCRPKIRLQDSGTCCFIVY